MSTLTPTLTLITSDENLYSGDEVAISATDALTLGANKAKIIRKISPNDVDPGGTQIFDTNLGKSYIYCKNIHATLTMWLAPAADTATGSCWMQLAPGEFTYFPWAGAVDLFVHTGANGQGIGTEGFEYIIFEA